MKHPRASSSNLHNASFVLISMLFFSGCANSSHAQSAGSSSGRTGDLRAQTATARNLGTAFASVAEQVSPSVVSIRVEARTRTRSAPFPFPFFGGQPDSGIAKGNGSGVVIRRDGYVLTNNHVVQNATRIQVVLRDGRRFDGKVVGTDPATDLAVVRITARGLPASSFADSGRVRPGEWSVAIGSPFGLDYTVTAGVVSAVGRGGLGANEIEDYIQTDASINPGNSGGPLVNLDGKVIGINTMIIGRGTGIGFAVPANLARRVADQIIDSGKVKRAWIGVSFQELTPELAAELGTGQPAGRSGALVASVVPGGPAAKAGLKPGDVVTSVDGEEIREGRDLLNKVIQKRVGQNVRVKVLRRGTKKTFTLRTGERPSQMSAAGGAAPNGSPANRFGMQLQALTPQIAQQLGMVGTQGVLVAQVAPGSPADRAGIRSADVIVEADRNSVRTPRQVRQALSDGSALLRLRRREGSFYVVLSKR